MAGPVPTCTGGEIAEGEDGEWVVTPDTDATEVEIAGLPAGATVVVPPTVTKVTGADDDKIGIRARVADGEDAVVTHDITGAFTITGGAIALNPEGEVKIGEKEIPVKPMIGGSDGEDAVVTQPFVVGEGSVAVSVKTIPGLKYTLVRGATVEGCRRDDGSTVVESKVAKDTTVTLTDDDPPEDKAFYVIGVSVP